MILFRTDSKRPFFTASTLMLAAVGCSPSVTKTESDPAVQFTASATNPTATESVSGVVVKKRGDAVVVADLRGVDAANLPDAVDSLASCPQLTELFLPAAAINETALRIVRSLTPLKRLRIVGPELDDQGALQMTGLARLDAITLQDTAVTDAGAAILATMPQLRDVSLMGSPVTDGVLASLRLCPQISKLRLRQTNVTGENFVEIEALPLTDLELAETEFGPAGMAAIAKLAKLQNLNLWLTRVDDSGLALLANHAELRSLNLDNCAAITTASLPVITSLSGLTLLHIGGTSINPAEVDQLASLKNLQSLFITRLGVSETVAASLKTKLPKLQRFEF